jgi:hypothetical protein
MIYSIHDQNLVTCFVFTKNRPSQLKQVLDYYSHTGWKLVVLDGSNLDFSIPNRSVTCQFTNVEHYQLCGTSVFQRLQLIEKICSTQFLILSPDDDFILGASIEQGITKLQGETECQMVYGDHCGFCIDQGLYFRPLWAWSTYFNINFILRPLHKLYNTFMFTQTARFYWCLYRSQYFYKMINMLTTIKERIYSYECAFAIYNLLSANPLYLDMPLLARNIYNKPVEPGGQRSDTQRKIYNIDKALAVCNTVNAFRPYMTSLGFDETDQDVLARIIKQTEEQPLNARTIEIIFPEFSCLDMQISKSPFGVMKRYEQRLASNPSCSSDTAIIRNIFGVN